MAEVHGTFHQSRPVISVEIAIAADRFGPLFVLADTGAAHILIVLPRERVSVDFVSRYMTWPEDSFFGVGSLQVRRVPAGVLRLRDSGGQLLELAIEPMHVLLYDLDESGFISRSIPPSLIGFQHAAFGLSQLLVDNASQRVVLTYLEPFTPTRLA